ncbi:sensor domain-containing diguanylate cyclase [Pacificimonas flava]|uniref:sensor domain-containing diguanylate cyclase n=1 Tax=Pacificimonas flava TaxID=1234595 RepID=UPI001CD03EB6|nr:sensor domain-containing diguanylate cyclase [Pacificimonas flava]
MEKTHLGLWRWCPQTGEKWVSPAAFRMLGYSDSSEADLSDLKAYFVDEGEWRGYRHMVARCLRGEIDMGQHEHRLRHRDGQVLWTVERIAVLERGADGRATMVCGARADISDRLEEERTYRWLAMHDPLTSLPNRRAFQESLENQFGLGGQKDRTIGLVFVDLDHLKAINDADGHAVGDSALRTVARALEAACHPPMTAARIGGDEFAVLLPGVTADELDEFASDLASAANEVSVSVGGALFPRDAVDQPSLEKAADAALYRAKESGRGRAVTTIG